MARRKPYEKIDINVEPFLSIMAIVLKLISLILVVIVMRIAMNPKGMKIVAPKDLFPGHGNNVNPKIPSYVDCAPEGLTLYPGQKSVVWEDLQRPDNEVDKMLDKVQRNSTGEYVIVLVRPHSLRMYRAIRNLVGKRPIEIGYDAIDADYHLDWNEAESALGVVKED